MGRRREGMGIIKVSSVQRVFSAQRQDRSPLTEERAVEML